MQDLISVIIPIYRVEDYLEECIQSIIHQTYRNLEIILVDDGSDDGCGEICDRYASMDARIKVIHQKNRGLDGARKAGISAATGEYVGYVDGDDWIEPEMYERLIEFAKKYDVDVVESGVIDSWIEDSKTRVSYLPEGVFKGKTFEKEIEPKLLYCGKFFRYGISPYVWNKLFKRELLYSFQMIKEILNSTADDVVVTIPSIAKAKSLYITYECYYHYRVRENSGKRRENNERVMNFIRSQDELKQRFKETKLMDGEDKQIDYFIMYWLLMNGPYVFDNLEEERILTPYGGIHRESKIVLYGAGAAGMHLHNYLERISANVVAWLDKNYKSLQKSMDVFAPDTIADLEYDYVIISILREEYVDDAKQEMKKLGVPEEKILWIEKRYINEPSELLAKISEINYKMR